MFKIGDVVYHTNLKRTGIIIDPTGLVYAEDACLVDFGSNKIEVSKIYLEPIFLMKRTIYKDAQMLLDPAYGGFNPLYADGIFVRSCVIKYGEKEWSDACASISVVLDKINKFKDTQLACLAERSIAADCKSVP